MTDTQGDDELISRVRSALASAPNVAEKKMFGGLAFMVDDKMCVTVNKGRIMVRIDPELTDAMAARAGAETMIMNGRVYRGYLEVDADAVRSDPALNEWIALALDFNARARKSPKKGRKDGRR